MIAQEWCEARTNKKGTLYAVPSTYGGSLGIGFDGRWEV
jgi:hypothetical protein